MSASRRPPRVAHAALLGVLATALAGCGGEGYFAHLLAGQDTVPAVFELPQRRTLVLVDDPADRFDDPNLPLTVAANVAHHLEEHGALKGKFVKAEALAEHRRKLGSAFADVPVDRIGRDLGAAQVIHVVVDEVVLEYVPGVFQPRASVQVKVIDAEAGRRLFPNPPTENQPRSPTPTRGHLVATELRCQGTDVTSRGARALMKRQLAEVLGRDIARQFYRWKPPEIGSRFDQP